MLKNEPASAVPTGSDLERLMPASVVRMSSMSVLRMAAPVLPTALFGSVAPFALR